MSSPELQGKDGVLIKTVEMHTGGEPLRVVVSGYPRLCGDTLLDKRRYARDHLDHLRRALMFEPRGHKDMYGAILVEKDADKADLAVLFIHCEGYGTMCGHAMLSLGRYAVDYGLVPRASPETEVKIQCPCGLVTAHVQYDSASGKSGRVRFKSVPAFAFAVNQKIEISGRGPVVYDLGYGGAFYALVSVQQFNVDLKTTPIQELLHLANDIFHGVKNITTLTHPDSADLAFLYGVILTDGCDTADVSNNICFFGEAEEVDRSPCGSGTTARLAVQYHKGQVKLDQERLIVQPKVGSEMRGRVVSTVTFGPYELAVVVEVSGWGHYTGRGEYWLEEGDPLSTGFLVE
ncbi:trans-L-3-hydroxyproline dehydratase-like [Halichondria panicea]|uniref:trans-L-3-hydroxyproline dehydratase-like n=1 Tax=Halichondria panicea TaxID=6063 RepID=UPI00312BBF10